MTIEVGDRVWFKTKFGNVAHGVYEGDEVMPSHLSKAGVKVHIIRSYDAFGKDSPKALRCAVPIGHMNHEHKFEKTDNWLIDKCKCGEERA